MIELLNMEFFGHAGMLIALMLGFTGYKIANCKPFKCDGEDFDMKKLWLGIARNLIVIISTIIVFIGSSLFCSDLALVQWGSTSITLQEAIDLITIAILGVYGVKYIKNVGEFAGIGDVIPKELKPAKDINNNIVVQEINDSRDTVEDSYAETNNNSSDTIVG